MRIPKLKKDKKYLLACSFGPDSMALFTLLEQDNIAFDVALVNYHLRSESDDEVLNLKKYCEAHNRKLYIKDVKDTITKNIEDTCREIRYDFFKSIYRENGYEALLVAHHEDDHIETYLLQINRQNLPKYFGIAPKTNIKGMTVIRPLLRYSKAELLDICKKTNTPYSIDTSNLKDDYERNKIRHEIVEKLSLSERRKYLKEIDNKNKELRAILSSVKRAKLGDVSYLLSLNLITYLYAINEAVQKLGKSLYISRDQGKEILKILKSDKPNVIANIKRGLVLVKAYDEVMFFKKLPEYKEYSYVVDSPKRLNTRHFYLDFRFGSKNRNVTIDDYPLTIRTIKEDDDFEIDGNVVNAKRVFIDWKMPLLVRKQWPVILNKDDKIIYVPRYQKSFKKDKDSNFYVKIRF